MQMRKLPIYLLLFVSETSKGDWKPLVFIIIDGPSTDNWIKGAYELKNRQVNIIACAAGFDADINMLKQITDNVVELKSASASDITSFFKWQSVSVSEKILGN